MSSLHLQSQMASWNLSISILPGTLEEEEDLIPSLYLFAEYQKWNWLLSTQFICTTGSPLSPFSHLKLTIFTQLPLHLCIQNCTQHHLLLTLNPHDDNLEPCLLALPDHHCPATTFLWEWLAGSNLQPSYTSTSIKKPIFQLASLLYSAQNNPHIPYPSLLLYSLQIHPRMTTTSSVANLIVIQSFQVPWQPIQVKNRIISPQMSWNVFLDTLLPSDHFLDLSLSSSQPST